MFGLIAAVSMSQAPQQMSSPDSRRVLITNDDGLTSNVVALYQTLKAQGYDVVVSVPCTNQSGAAASIQIRVAIGALAHACRADAAHIGDPGAGPITRNGFASDFFYVDGTPVMALLYGLDLVATRRWHHLPDLVLSGPNEGRNVGRLSIASGTIGAAQFAALRGVPAIALSAADTTASGNGIDNPASHLVALSAAELITALDRQAKGGPLLPGSVVLSVNFPDDLARAKWRLTKIGSYEAYTIRFAANVQDTSTHPAILIGTNQQTPRSDQMKDEAVVARRDVTVSLLGVGYGEAPAAASNLLHLNRLVRRIGAARQQPALPR